jgi:hypothetical protein
MKSMKNLLLAVAGLAGFGLAGSAFAQCADTNLTAWSSAFTSNANTALHVVAGGLEASPSACKLTATLGSLAAPQNATAVVVDNTPSSTVGGEPRYRARFYFNVDTITGTGVDASVQANIANMVGVNISGGFQQVLRVFAFGNGTHGTFIRLIAACANSPTSDSRCRKDLPVLAAGNHYIEVDIQTGASGYVNYWLDQDATAGGGTKITGTSASTTLDMSAWGGVNQFGMGLGGGSPNYRSRFGTAVLSFDAFDSRRQTAIGP